MTITVTDIYNFNDPNKVKQTSGHEVHLRTVTVGKNGQTRHGITKINKYAGTEGQVASTLETSFTALANLYTVPKHALKQDLIIHNEKIRGVFSEHAAHALLRIQQDNPQAVFLNIPSSAEINSKDPFKNLLQSTGIPNPLTATHPSDALKNADYQKKLEDALAWRDGVDAKSWATLATEYWTPERWVIKYADYLMPQNAQTTRTKSIALISKNKENQVNNSSKISLAEEIIAITQQKQCYTLLLEQMKGTKPIPTCNDLMQHESLSQFDTTLIETTYTKIAEKLQRFEKAHEQVIQNTTTSDAISAFNAGKGFNFLNEMPQDFFSKLMAARKSGEVNIDMESLADLLATAYGLEEDDLHKGNIGFYITQENSKPCFHFFKIDHDLMFNEQIIVATGGARLANLSYTEGAFRINAQSLKNFPDITSGSHYWPTKNPSIATGNKAYKDERDILAYKSLQYDNEFIQAKWTRFLKQAVMPKSLIEASITAAFDGTKNLSIPQNQLMVEQAAIKKISEMTIALLEVPEFREFITQDIDKPSTLIKTEIETHAKSIGLSDELIKSCLEEVDSQIKKISIACQLGERSGYTHMHMAIATNSYRSFESTVYFKPTDYTKVDKHGATPLDLAIRQFEKLYVPYVNKGMPKINLSQTEHRELKYFADTITDLLAHESTYGKDSDPLFTKDEDYQKLFENAQHITKLTAVRTNSLEDFESRLDLIYRQNDSLKSKKIQAINILHNASLTKSELTTLKTKLNTNPPPEPYCFIKQLSSSWWIVKQIKGLYGATSAYNEMQKIIDLKMNALISRSEKPLPADLMPDEAIIKEPYEQLRNVVESQITWLKSMETSRPISDKFANALIEQKKSNNSEEDAKNLYKELIRLIEKEVTINQHQETAENLHACANILYACAAEELGVIDKEESTKNYTQEFKERLSKKTSNETLKMNSTEEEQCPPSNGLKH